MQEDTAGAVKAGDSFWTMEGGELQVTLQKMSKGEMWPSALAGRGQVRRTNRLEGQTGARRHACVTDGCQSL